MGLPLAPTTLTPFGRTVVVSVVDTEIDMGGIAADAWSFVKNVVLDELGKRPCPTWMALEIARLDSTD